MGTRAWTKRRTIALAVVLTVGLAPVALAPTGAGAVQAPQSVVVNPNPVDFTPHVLDGHVNAIAQVGSTIYLGGQFTRVRSATSTTELTRSNFVAFNATTGVISSFAPTFNGEVTSIVGAPDGSIYIGGFFTLVNASAASRLVRLNPSTGARVAGFNPPALTGPVRDLRLVANRLWLAGNFTHVGGVAQRALATLNATTGARDPFMSLAIAGVQNGGTTLVLKIDVTPDGRRLFAVGNFATLNGQPANQIFALDIGGASAVAAPWRTSAYAGPCLAAFNTYMRDLDISPDGSYVVVASTGAYRAPPAMCDTVARFEVGASGTNVQPTWVDYSGGDTLSAVAVTGEAVYVGGHQRWMNNPFVGDAAGAGAVARSGIAALDPANGLPVSWNPGRTRGAGVFDMLGTPTGLWVGSDTDRIGNNELHGRIAFFPVQGGTALPDNNLGRLPGRAYLLGVGTTNNVVGRFFDGDVAGAAQTFANGGIAWQSIRGAVMIDGTLYNGQSDGNFVGRSYNGTTFGAPFSVNTSDLVVNDAAWHTDVRNITGMFFTSGRLYYTVAGQSALYYRYFTPESRVIGAQRFTASANVSGLDFAVVRTMFLGGGHLYWTTTANGNLQRIPFQNGLPGGAVATVSGPGVDGVDWSAQDIVLFTGAVTGPGPNQPPNAIATATCTGLTCNVSGSGSNDPDPGGSIASHSWNFGDSTPAVAGATAAHTYAAAGTYTITLTVTDNLGATGTTTRSVTVGPPVAGAISFVGGATTSANSQTHRVNLPAATQAGDGLLLFATSNNVNAVMSAPTGGGTWTLVDTIGTDSVVTRVWKAAAGTAPANALVQLTTSEYAKLNLTVLAYRGTAPDPVAAFARVAGSTSSTSHATPTVNVPAAGAWVVSYWAQKDSDTAPLTAPSGVTTRSAGSGVPNGRVVSLAADSGAPVPAGPYGAKVATAAVASHNVTMWSIVLRPA